MALTEQQHKAREGKMTGSRIASIMSGDAEAMYDLWLELTGDPSWKAPDFTYSWAVQLGNATEQFHLDWIQRDVGLIGDRGRSVVHATVPWAGATLDGWLAPEKCPVEAKHVGGFEGMPVIIERYMPQMQWTMYVTDAPECLFSVIMGAKQPEKNYIARDEDYITTLVKQAKAFMQCVWDLREPVPNPYVKPPAPVFTRTADMTGNNSWGVNAAQWLELREGHIRFGEAAKAIKLLVPTDAKKAFGYGVVVSRSKTGALTIRPEKDEDNGQSEGTTD